MESNSKKPKQQEEGRLQMGGGQSGETSGQDGAGGGQTPDSTRGGSWTPGTLSLGRRSAHGITP